MNQRIRRRVFHQLGVDAKAGEGFHARGFLIFLPHAEPSVGDHHIGAGDRAAGSSRG